MFGFEQNREIFPLYGNASCNHKQLTVFMRVGMCKLRKVVENGKNVAITTIRWKADRSNKILSQIVVWSLYRNGMQFWTHNGNLLVDVLACCAVFHLKMTDQDTYLEVASYVLQLKRFLYWTECLTV